MRARAVAPLAAALLGVNCLVNAAESATLSTTVESLDGIGRSIANEKCVRPASVLVERVANRYEPVTDEIRKFVCPGYRVVVYEAHASGVTRELPMEVAVSRQISKLPPNVAVGASANSIKTLLGTPYSESAKALVYSSSPERPGEDTITFQLKSGRVSRVVWNWELE